MALRKDDPIYYRNKIADLIKQAIDEGLEVNADVDDQSKRVMLTFKSDNGEMAGIKLSGETSNEYN